MSVSTFIIIVCHLKVICNECDAGFVMVSGAYMTFIECKILPKKYARPDPGAVAHRMKYSLYIV